MYYCDLCATKHGWPCTRNVLACSYGRCEICGKTALCADVPSKHLPLPAKKPTEAPPAPSGTPTPPPAPGAAPEPVGAQETATPAWAVRYIQQERDEARGQRDAAMVLVEHQRAELKRLRAALEALVADTRRYYEERPVSEAQMYDPAYKSARERAAAALAPLAIKDRFPEAKP